MNPESSIARHTPGRFLQALAAGNNRTDLALAWLQSQPQGYQDPTLYHGIQALAETYDSSDFPAKHTPIADAFLARMFPVAIPLRIMANMRRVPLRTRIFVSAGDVIAAEVAEGAGTPVMASAWTETTLLSRKWGGISIKTDDLVRNPSPVVSAGITDELSTAVAQGVNFSFINPGVTGSLLASAPNFAGTGGTIAQVAADLLRLGPLVPGAYLGGVYVMHPTTSTYLGLLFGSGGAPAFPGLGPAGGMLNGLPVFTTTAAEMLGSPTSRVIALISPSEIFWASDDVVRLTTSKEGALQVLAAPTNKSTGVPVATTLVTMWQTESVALKAIFEANWFTRTGAAAYFTVSY